MSPNNPSPQDNLQAFSDAQAAKEKPNIVPPTECSGEVYVPSPTQFQQTFYYANTTIVNTQTHIVETIISVLTEIQTTINDIYNDFSTYLYDYHTEMTEIINATYNDIALEIANIHTEIQEISNFYMNPPPPPLPYPVPGGGPVEVTVNVPPIEVHCDSTSPPPPTPPPEEEKEEEECPPACPDITLKSMSSLEWLNSDASAEFTNAMFNESLLTLNSIAQRITDDARERAGLSLGKLGK